MDWAVAVGQARTVSWSVHAGPVLDMNTGARCLGGGPDHGTVVSADPCRPHGGASDPSRPQDSNPVRPTAEGLHPCIDDIRPIDHGPQPLNLCLQGLGRQGV